MTLCHGKPCIVCIITIDGYTIKSCYHLYWGLVQNGTLHRAKFNANKGYQRIVGFLYKKIKKGATMDCFKYELQFKFYSD